MYCSECSYITGHADTCVRGTAERVSDLEGDMKEMKERMSRVREMSATDAPPHYSAEEAGAWASGFNAALTRLGLI